MFYFLTIDSVGTKNRKKSGEAVRWGLWLKSILFLTSKHKFYDDYSSAALLMIMTESRLSKPQL